jgi:hypothetical protein
MSARRHTANENPGIGRHVLHPYSIAKQRAAGKRTRRINRDYAHLLAASAIERREPVDQRALPSARRPGDAYDQRIAGVRKYLLEQAGRVVTRVLNRAYRAADRAFIPGKNFLCQLVHQWMREAEA